ncbi:MAG TPA: hypothetical protein DDW93_03490 [Firmicutes bacterium]|jgi:hypothetical protein|nr:hypothetical protein [Bacillota bacterium]HBK69419.1 hypothetical protein [Bacillota bacterium]
MKKTTIYTVSLISLLFLSALFFLLFSSLRPKSKPVALLPLVREEKLMEAETTKDLPQFKGVEISLVDQANKLNWKLTVEKLIEEDGLCLLSGIKGEYYTLSGQTYLVEAAQGEMGKDFSWLRLFPEATLSGRELSLQAEELSWDSRSGEEITGNNLFVTNQDLKIRAKEFRFKPEEGGLVIPGESRWSFR